MVIFIGVLFSAVVTFFSMGMLDLQLIVNPALFMIFIMILVFFFCVTKSGGILGGYIKSSFRKNHRYSVTELEGISRSAKNTIKMIFAAGWFAFLTALIVMLGNLNFDYPDAAMAFQHGLGISLTSPFYAVVMGYFIFFPLHVWAENKISRIKKEQALENHKESETP